MKVAKILLMLMMTVIASSSMADKPDYAAILKQLHLPNGFKISVYAEVPYARSLALGDNGIVYVGSLEPGGNVYAIEDRDGDGIAEQRYQLAEKLYMPNGVAYQDGALYVAEVNRIIRFDHISQHLDHPPQPVVVYDKFPTNKHHGWKYLRFGPDHKLYTAVGAPCNICEPEKEIFTALLRLDADGSNLEILARGIRNSVGFDWEPATGHLFFNDNGRDYLGDDVPPEELNELLKPRQHYGYPYCHAGSIVDPEFGANKTCSDYVAPAWKYKAHIAPLGMRFYTGSQFPEPYRQQLFVAQHGSWNRTQPQGYQIALIKFRSGKPVSEQVFIDGWLSSDNSVLGRPVDILQLPNGSLLISDDKLGVIYKVEYQGE